MFALALRYLDREYYSVVEGNKEIVFGSGKHVYVQIPDAPEWLLSIKFKDSRIRIATKQGKNAEIEYRTNELIYPFADNYDISIYVSVIIGTANTRMVLPYNGMISAGRKDDNDIILGYPIVSGHHFQLSCENGTVHVIDLESTNHLYLNGKKINRYVMKNGDVLSIFTFRFLLKNGALFFENIGDTLRFSDRASSFLEVDEVEVIPESVLKEDDKYLRYHLSPRIREEMPTEPIYLAPVPEQARSLGGSRGNMAFLLGSGAMMAASLATGFVSPVMLLARLAGMISPAANMARYSKLSKEEKKQLEEYEQLRQTKYQEYIEDQKARIVKVANIQRRILTTENQSPKKSLATVDNLSRNLWERMPTDDDFLTTRLGIGRVKLCVEVKTKRDDSDFKLNDDDELETLSNKIIEETRLVDNTPVCVPLKKLQTVGIIGAKDRIVYLLRAMLVELTALHSPTDVKLVFLADKHSLSRWGILRWLPHIWDETKQVRYISFDDDSRHVICELLEDIIRKRKNDNSFVDPSSKKDPLILPHYIVIAESRELLCRESIYEDLTSNNPNLGITTILLSDDLYGLPQKCQVVIEAKEKPCVYSREALNEKLVFDFDDLIHQKDMEYFTRRISAIELDTGNNEIGIPNSVTFLQGYNALDVKDLKILDRWENSEPYRTLAAPIGVMNGGKLFALNVMSGEGAHGPHGLLAGTTGSGKSELLQTWILSMAVSYHPHDVNFVIIDYKGGGMSDLMEPLPHVVGKITNIDRNINRSLVALKSELKRRQQLFAKVGVNSIEKYQRAYKNGDVDQPLPHLIIVTDEFAEMKKEEPEFMTELNSVATVGRSLGIHMLLATQKPAGVVTDQINSNSRFRICMKVQDVTDSREMLKRPDAAKITQSGRAYYRIGEDEDFGLFQSFYSGAEYIENKKTITANENQVRIVGVTGERINPVVRSSERKADQKDELTAITEEINRICKLNGITKMPGPWLPELPRWLSIKEVIADSDDELFAYKSIDDGIRIPIGKYDIPEHQVQGVSYLNLSEVGHCGIYGMPGSGKTVFLKTLITSIGYLYSSKDVNITVFDAGSWSLTELEKMPHIKEVILNQDNNRIDKFIGNIRRELSVRKEAFVKKAVNSLAAYRASTMSDLPAIIIIVDGITQLFEQNMQFEEVMTEIASSGSTYGIHLVYTANSSIGFKYKFTQLIKHAIALQLPDKGDYLNIVGRIPNGSVPAFPGRAFVKGNPPISVQLAVYSEYSDEIERHKDIDNIITEVIEAETNLKMKKKATPASSEDAEEDTGNRTTVMIGTDIKTLDKVHVDLASDYVLMITGDNDADSRNVLISVRKQFESRADCQVMRIDETNYSESLTDLVELLGNRKKQRKEQVWDEEHTEEKWLSGYQQICIILENIRALVNTMDDKDKKTLRRIITLSSGLGVVFVAYGDKNTFEELGTDILCSALIESKNVIGTVYEPADYSFLRQRVDNVGWIGLEQGEAFVLAEKSLDIVSISKEVT